MQSLVDPANYAFTAYALPVLIFGALNVVLGLYTLRHERGSAVSVAFFLATLPVAIWLISFSAVYSTTSPAVAATWIKLAHLGVFFIPVSVFFAAATVEDQRSRSRTMILAGVLVAVALYVVDVSTPWIIQGVHHYYFGYYPIFSWKASWALFVYFGVYLGATMHLNRVSLRTTQSVLRRRRLKPLMIGLAVANLAVIDFLPDFHVPVYPVGYVFIGAFTAIYAWTIMRYRLADITPALAAQQIIQTMAEGLIVIDRDGVVRVSNDAAAAMWGEERTLAGLRVGALDARMAQPILADAVGGAESAGQVTYGHSDGTARTAVISSAKLLDRHGDWVGTVFIIHDITERWQAEIAVRSSEERFRSLVQNASDLITVIDPDTTIRYQSPAIRHVLGYDAETALGQQLAAFVHPEDSAKFFASLGDLMTKPAGTITGEGRVRDSLGAWRHLEFTGSDQRDNPAIGGLVLNVRDVSERKQLEERLRDQALHDPLTKLANRTKFADRLDHALRRRGRSNRHLAVLFMDLDNFKGVNDRFGHSVGDLLLTQVAERVERCLRPGDTAARFGGDEFALLLEDLGAGEEATGVAARLFEALQDPFDVAGTAITVRASVGIATTTGESEPTADDLLRNADIAMYVAKSQGKDCYSVYDPAMQESMLERLELVADLPRALDRGEFILQYQPMFRLRSNALAGVEALLRWQHPKRGLVPPQEFITLAEDSGAILAIGSWVLTHACHQASEWQRAFPAVTGWTMSVNVSAKQLQQASFVEEVASALRESCLEPSHLMLEITESVMMVDAGLMLRRLRELKGLGVRLAIDDFGTGYSSLSYLRQFPFDLLKIDKSFIDDLGSVGHPRELTQAIIELGRTLDLELVAEGIERGEQLTKLQSMNCELGQGFLFARPLDGGGIEELLESLQREAEAA